MSEQALTTRTTAPLPSTAQEATVPGLDDFGREEMVIPRLRLVQAQSGFSDDAGKIHNSLTGAAKDQLTIMVIGAKKGRVKWPPGEFNREMKVQCASDDGLHAREGLAGAEADGTPTMDCARCVYAQWSDSDDGKRVPPPCSAVLNFLVVDIADDLPSLVSFKRTSMAAGKQLVTLVKSFGFRRTFILSTAPEQGPRGKYHVFQVAAGEAVVPERLAHYVQLAEQFREQTITTDTEDDKPARRDDGDTSFVPEDYERQ